MQAGSPRERYLLQMEKEFPNRNICNNKIEDSKNERKKTL